MADESSRDQRGDELKQLNSEDANAILTDQPAQGAGPGRDERSAIGGGRNEASPGGARNTGAAGNDLPQNELWTTGREQVSDSGNQGTLGTGGYNDYGRIVGPDSPAGDAADLGSQSGDAQGDDLADRLGGGEGRGVGASGAGSATGDLSAGSSGEGEASNQDRAAPTTGSDETPGATEVGGMGGVRGHTNGTRPPGGESPVPDDAHDRAS